MNLFAAEVAQYTVSLDGTATTVGAYALLALGGVMVLYAAWAGWNMFKLAQQVKEDTKKEGNDPAPLSIEAAKELLEGFSKLNLWQGFLIAGVVVFAMGAWLLTPDVTFVVNSVVETTTTRGA